MAEEKKHTVTEKEDVQKDPKTTSNNGKTSNYASTAVPRLSICSKFVLQAPLPQPAWYLRPLFGRFDEINDNYRVIIWDALRDKTGRLGHSYGGNDMTRECQ